MSVGVIENVVPYGDVTASEYLIEDWVWEEAAIANNLSFEAFDELPIAMQQKMAEDYINLLNSKENDY